MGLAENFHDDLAAAEVMSDAGLRALFEGTYDGMVYATPDEFEDFVMRVLQIQTAHIARGLREIDGLRARLDP